MVVTNLLVVVALAQATQCSERETGECEFEGTLERRLGVAKGVSEGYDFSSVPAMTITRSGYLYVLQPVDHGFVVFDTAGIMTRRVGRQGDGPGEFQWPGAVGWKADTLWVADSRHGRVSLFDETGTFLRSSRFPSLIGETYSLGTPVAVFADGDLLFQTLVRRQQLARGTAPRLPVVRLDQSNRVRDTLTWLATRNEQLFVPGPGGNQAGFYGRQPFADYPLLAVGRAGRFLYVVDRWADRTDDKGDYTFQVTRLAEDGETIWARQYEYVPAKLSSESVDAVVNEIVEALVSRVPEAFASKQEVKRAMLRGLYTPEYWPPVEQALADRDGRLWLRRWGPPQEAAVWTVIEADGEMMGRVRLPSALRLHTAMGRRVWGVVLDEMDIPYVEMYRVEMVGG